MDVNKLRELAQNATQGNWESSNDGFVSMRRMRNDVRYVVGIAQCDHRAEDADFIAAANPAAILELIDRLEAAERDAKRYRVLRDSKYQLDEDDICVSDSFFTQYFGEELDAEVDALRVRHDAAMRSEDAK